MDDLTNTSELPQQTEDGGKSVCQLSDTALSVLHSLGLVNVAQVDLCSLSSCLLSECFHYRPPLLLESFWNKHSDTREGSRWTDQGG